MSMKPSQLATLLAEAIPARLPVLVIGGPGVGKTSIVGQAAKAAKNDLVISHPAVADPTDAKGFPWVEQGAKVATFIPFGETARVLGAKKPTTWFLDDLGQAPPAVQASYMPWLLARQVNGHRLPDHVTIIAATNRRTDRAGVSGVLEPVKSRFAAIVELEPDLDEWCQWALRQPNFPPALVAFLRFKAGDGLLYKFTPTADLVNSPSPRTWEATAQWMMRNLPASVAMEAYKGAVGEAAAVELAAFLQMYAQLPNIDAILMDPDRAEVPNALNVLYAVTTALASKTTTTTFTRIARYAQRLVDMGKAEFAVLMLRDAIRREPSVQTTPAFTKLVAGELGQLMSGAVA